MNVLAPACLPWASRLRVSRPACKRSCSLCPLLRQHQRDVIAVTATWVHVLFRYPARMIVRGRAVLSQSPRLGNVRSATPGDASILGAMRHRSVCATPRARLIAVHPPCESVQLSWLAYAVRGHHMQRTVSIWSPSSTPAPYHNVPGPVHPRAYAHARKKASKASWLPHCARRFINVGRLRLPPPDVSPDPLPLGAHVADHRTPCRAHNLLDRTPAK
ncbi:hypothetical protein DAEQUDRAFT_551120 [Daedalea quercina L-15889]|uniref:Uncharacterized protein n=1 Tax=Daedalea quercina L-15889 TaxID=1314783 RepID=A0A165T3A8_9APHY|nr:hypothetical protein DAEQUDRAFT_551120 [Daedalea quercina L-15889]